MRTWIKWLGVVAVMALIFSLSHQPAALSSELSGGIAEWVAAIVERMAPGSSFDMQRLDHVIRKNAHFFIYLVLGLVTMFALKSVKITGARAVKLAMLLCVLFAISDETHQMFVPGRGAQVRDVFIDGAGSAIGIGLYMLIGWIRRGKRETNHTRSTSGD